MNKLLFLLFFTTLSLSAQGFDRNILIEVFTNSHCSLCPAAHNTIDSYLASSANAEKVTFIYYHMTFPYSDDPINQANTGDASGRNNYYGPFSSTPITFFDGTTQSGSYSQWAANINSRLDVKSPVNILLSGSQEGSTVTIKADLEFSSGFNLGSAVIHFIVVEDVTYAGRNGINNHKNVMRKMITSPTGESITTVGFQTANKSISLPESWNKNNLSFLVFIQNSVTKEVCQSEIIDYNSLVVTGITDESLSPNRFDLFQNYPNPFNPSTTIEYNVPSSELVSLSIYDVLGVEIVTLVNEKQAAGKYKVLFNSLSVSGGKGLPSGIYFYKLNIGDLSITKKMSIVK
ncbi:MAG: Omp28-related outer membrane protein [Bacteroidetes bacterium]|nr:Omp28-related outer membrane protein [Bacteroidota bacterium]